MELEIYSPSADGFVKEITWNHEEIKREVAERVSRYQNIVYTDDQIKDAKTDRANLRKFAEALEAKRKEIKKQCLEPYEAFEKQVKEITAIVNEPIMLIDRQIKEYEEGKREEKRAAIEAYWITLSDDGKIPEGISLAQIFNEKWLNASVDIKTVCSEIHAKLDQIEKDLHTLAEMPEFAFEAAEVYRHTLDLNKAITEGKRLVEMQKRKAEAERLRAEQEAARKAEAEAAMQNMVKAMQNTAKAANDATKATQQMAEAVQQAKQWLSFAALLSMEDAVALKDFFNSRNIEFKKI